MASHASHSFPRKVAALRSRKNSARAFGCMETTNQKLPPFELCGLQEVLNWGNLDQESIIHIFSADDDGYGGYAASRRSQSTTGSTRPASKSSLVTASLLLRKGVQQSRPKKVFLEEKPDKACEAVFPWAEPALEQ